jgi:hypothetical protein
MNTAPSLVPIKKTKNVPLQIRIFRSTRKIAAKIKRTNGLQLPRMAIVGPDKTGI